MHKSLRFERPVEEITTYKRPRRRINCSPHGQSTISESFSYKCYDCGTPYNMSLNDKNPEIECSRCSSRVICKETSKKPHVLEAV